MLDFVHLCFNILNSHLVVAESDGESPIVAVHNLNAVVSRAAGQSNANKINRNCLILGRFYLGHFWIIIPHQTFISQGYFKYFKPYCDILGYWYSLHADMVCIHNNIVIFWDTFWDIT